MRVFGLDALAVGAAVIGLAGATPPATETQTAPSSGWRALATDMARPWPDLQRRDKTFSDYVVAANPHGPPRDPYGRAFMGLALLQAGLRDDDQAQISAGLASIGASAAHPGPRDRIIFENLALETAYNLARAKLNGDDRFAKIRGPLETRMKRISVVQFGGTRPYYNYHLVESAGLVELLASGLRSKAPGSALADRRRTKRLVTDLVNRTIPRVAARYATPDAAGRLTLVSDPPWNPPAYDAFSLALLARIVDRLGPAAGERPREVMRAMARSLWALASPEGSVSYYGRSQEQAWTLTMTAYGALAAAHLPGTSQADAARFEALADRALTRLRERYAGGRFGFWITPSLAHGIRAAIPGLDAYAAASSYSGLTLVGLAWALDEMGDREPAPGPLAADRTGVHRVGAGESTVLTVRTPFLWYAVKQGPGAYVRGVGDYRDDVRYDSGLIALEAIDLAGPPAAIIPLRPHQLRGDDRSAPVLLRGRGAGRFWGTRLRAAADAVELSGGFRAGDRWLRRGVRIRYEPTGCGLRETIPTRRGDRLVRMLWFRGSPKRSSGGTVLSDGVQRVTLSAAPTASAKRAGYASGTESRLTRVALRFRGTGKPLTFTYCRAGTA